MLNRRVLMRGLGATITGTAVGSAVGASLPVLEREYLPTEGEGEIFVGWLSLHTLQPDMQGSQNLFEADFGGYERKPIRVTKDELRLCLSPDGQMDVSNRYQIALPTPQEDSDCLIRAWAVGTQQVGEGFICASGEISTPYYVCKNFDAFFMPGNLRVTFS